METNKYDSYHSIYFKFSCPPQHSDKHSSSELLSRKFYYDLDQENISLVWKNQNADRMRSHY